MLVVRGDFLVANLNLQDNVCGPTLVRLSGRFLILPLKLIYISPITSP